MKTETRRPSDSTAGVSQGKSFHVRDLKNEFWEDDGEIRLEDERAWFFHVYLRVGRNPYEVCLHSSLKLPGGDTLLDVHPTQLLVAG